MTTTLVMTRTVLETPVGPMLAVASDHALCALEFMERQADTPGPFGAMRTGASRESRLKERLARWYGAPALTDGTNRAIDLAHRWLDAYFAGESADISSLPLDMRGAPFEQRVWAALRRIQPGEITTYGAIAKQLGAPGASRAVGMANGANPIAIIVPCHRVIGRNGTLTGYGGGLDRKTWLLNHERRWRNALPL